MFAIIVANWKLIRFSALPLALPLLDCLDRGRRHSQVMGEFRRPTPIPVCSRHGSVLVGIQDLRRRPDSNSLDLWRRGRACPGGEHRKRMNDQGSSRASALQKLTRSACCYLSLAAAIAAFTLCAPAPISAFMPAVDPVRGPTK
jgi:hypothetical protein